MIELAKHTGIFHVYDNPGYTTDELYLWVVSGRDFKSLPGLLNYQKCKNTLMSNQKLAMANAVYPKTDKLIITTQTALPADSETSYTGQIYATVPSDEFYRSGNINPYRVAWNITSDLANGNWGSFILVTESGAMINRALAGVTKSANTAKIVDFEGSVTS